MLSTAVATISPAGTWGDTLKQTTGKVSPNFPTSVTQECFGYKACLEEKQKQANKFAKFVS